MRFFASGEPILASRLLSSATRARCERDLLVGLLRIIQQPADQLVAQLRRQPLEQFLGIFELLIRRQAEAQAELGTVLEQRVRPRRPAPFVVHRIRRARQIAAVDRRAARGVADEHAIAEELRQELDVRRLAAAGACAGELEQRQQELRALDRVGLDLRPIHVGNRHEEVVRGALAVQVRQLRLHVDRLVLDLRLVLGRADVDAQAAAGAIVGSHLHDKLPAGELLALVVGRSKTFRSLGQQRRIEGLHANRRVRATERTQPALRANLRIPDGNVLGDAAFFVLRGCGRERPVSTAGRRRSGRRRDWRSSSPTRP